MVSFFHMAQKTKKQSVKKVVQKQSTRKVSKKHVVVQKKQAPKQVKKQKKVVFVSGGFDPVHIGHVRMFREARALGDKLIVVVNNDHWIRLKKGYAFMPDYERKEIIESFESVDEVYLSSHVEGTTDMSISEDLRKFRPHIFAKGGDRHSGNIPETPVCEEIGCKIVNDVGYGGKVQSSSWLIAKSKEMMEETKKKQAKKQAKKVVKKVTKKVSKK
jgi:D-beta-D-heptose 7-phosphate kinase/D-beta-D-heptose 1-phosphate adenosyltransferase